MSRMVQPLRGETPLPGFSNIGEESRADAGRYRHICLHIAAAALLAGAGVPGALAIDPTFQSDLLRAAEEADAQANAAPRPLKVVEPQLLPSEIQRAEKRHAAAAVVIVPARRPVAQKSARSGDLWQRIRRGFAIPDLYNHVVTERESMYASRPVELAAMLERSRRYLFHIVEEIEKRGMPMEIALLPMVESAFDPLAYSQAKASGLWQFIPSTAEDYKLTQNWWYDGRRDIIASTDAALDYLQALHDMYGDWDLALASYNWGENAVARAIEQNRKAGLKTDYWSLPLPDETRNYIPKLQALKNILRKPAMYGIDLPRIPNAPYFVTVALTRDIDLRLAAELAEVPLEELVQLNPGHNRPVIESSVAPHLVLPADHLDRFLRNIENHDAPLSAWGTYTLKPGDFVERIAAAHGISAAMLRLVNSLPRRIILHPGDKLLVPMKGAMPATDIVPEALQPLLNAADRDRSPTARGVVIPASIPAPRRAAPIIKGDLAKPMFTLATASPQ